jgi:hypothetical protein
MRAGEMGTDIHFFVEKKGSDGHWSLVDKLVYNARDSRYYPDRKESFFDERSYDTFAILAGVRNGYGFAGRTTGGGFRPVSPSKGLPPDCSEEFRRLEYPYKDYAYSHSYLSVHELINYDWSQIAVKRGVLTFEEFENWADSGDMTPREWCNSIIDDDIKMISQAEAMRVLREFKNKSGIKERAQFDTLTRNTFVQCSWMAPYYALASEFCDRTLPRMVSLCATRDINGQYTLDYNAVRCVFFFTD